MVRLSFVVGGGKLVRQKYSDDLPKLFMASLSNVGYVNDESAAVEVGSAGKYKYQHDTNKNLKFVHVFPRLAAPDTGDAGEDEEDEEEEEADEDLTEEQRRLLRSSDEQFERICDEALMTYGQKKNALDFMKARVAKWNEIDEKVRNCEQLSPEEDKLYNSDIDITSIEAKDKVLSAKIQEFIEKGQLSAHDQKNLLATLEGKLAQIEKSGKKAPAKLLETIKQVKECDPKPLPPLRHAEKIKEHSRKIAQLKSLEASLKGKLGTIEQTRALAEEPLHKEALETFTQKSRGWFESEDVFQQRLEACLKSVAAPKRSSGSGSGGGGGGKGAGRPSSSGGFTTVSGGARPAKAKGAAASTRNAFGALG